MSEASPDIPPLNIEGLVYAYQLVTGHNEGLDKFLFETVPAHYPDQVVEVWSKFATHPEPRLRQMAAIGIQEVILVDTDESFGIAEKLLADKDDEVSSLIRGSLRAMAQEEDVPTELLLRLDKLCIDAAARRGKPQA